ncbi:ketopantoate reductase family protein [Haloglomus litoreum]|uniref:ketopantoate reductase family protein n=1 Tax=Haloglomus litoreum TaxID=3034026 RepID=UPI0023E7EA98|nr:2-dehydropantoate 2-reductase [Haloglomus sp. DT116]
MNDSEYEAGEGTEADGTPQERPGVEWARPGSVGVCVIGAGAMGGLLGGRLANAGADVSLVDQGAHREAMAENGLTLLGPDDTRHVVVNPTVRADTADLGTQDLVILSVKAYDLPSVAPSVGPLVGPETVILPVQNGIPWWYFHGFDGELEGHRIESVDPDGVVERHIDTERVIGCVPFAAGEVVEPGVVRHTEGRWFPVGELDGTTTPRIRGITDLLGRIGLRSRVLDDVRSELWLKALGNLSFNPVSALTRATLGEICRDPETRALVRTMMEEAKAVAEALGASFRRSIDDRIEGAETVGDHRTSMLQDLERGDRLELEALVGTVLELAEVTGKPAPTIRTVYRLTHLLDETRRR